MPGGFLSWNGFDSTKLIREGEIIQCEDVPPYNNHHLARMR